MATLSRLHLRVTLPDRDPLEVTTVLADQVAYEATRARRKWPLITDGGVGTWWSFMAWQALTRTGAYHGTYEEFVAAALDVESLDDDPAGGDVDPTQPAEPAS